MAKTFSNCSLCGAPKFLNSINLCKRCAKSPESAKIRGTALKAQAADLAEQEQYEQSHPHEAAVESSQDTQNADASSSDDDAKSSDEKEEKKE